MLLMLVVSAAHAQLDSSSALLLSPSGVTPSPESLRRRYKIRKRVPESRPDDDLEEEPGTVIASPVPKNRQTKASTSTPTTTTTTTTTTTIPKTTNPATAPTILSVSPSPSVPPPPPTTANGTVNGAVPDQPHPPITVQVKELILGGTDEDIDQAKRQIDSEDFRSNILSISMAPAYFYDGSSSNYSFRNYHSDGPGFGLGMNLWLTPFFGLQSRYFSSVSSSMRDGPNSVPVDTQEFEAGLRFRRHFGYTRKSAQLSWGIDYHDFSNKISPDATTAVGSKTSGLSLSLEGSIPIGATYAHTFEVTIRPYQHHSEQSTSINAQSGGSSETNAVSLSLGGEWTLDHKNQVFWKTEYGVERNLFQGQATVTDPKTGQTPNGVSVTDSLVIFYFGFKWGT